MDSMNKIFLVKRENLQQQIDDPSAKRLIIPKLNNSTFLADDDKKKRKKAREGTPEPKEHGSKKQKTTPPSDANDKNATLAQVKIEQYFLRNLILTFFPRVILYGFAKSVTFLQSFHYSHFMNP